VLICYPGIHADGSQESASKEVELHGDDPKALMAMLRHIYGLPCDQWTLGETEYMQQHALTFVVAEK